MTADQVNRLIDAVAHLLGVLVWPAVVLVLFLLFRRAVTDFLGDVGEFSVKAPGVEATGKRRREEVAALLGAATTARAGTDGEPGEASDPSDIAAALPGPRAQRRLAGARVLWVDDRPANNRFERQALEAFGVRVDLSESTGDALDQTARRPYDLIISDMGRPPDDRAGYTLLDRLRADGDRTPFIIYASSRAPEHRREARERGALGCTNQPRELLSMVTDVLTARRPR